jgi:hypothetical protein
MTALVSETIIAVQPDHDCCGEDCPVCLLMQRVENFSRQLKNAAARPGFSSGDLLPVIVVLNFAVLHLVPLNSVRLKVKMNR